METTSSIVSTSPRRPDRNGSSCSLHSLPVTLLGDCCHWFEVCKEGESLVLTPKHSLPARCTIRPAALFRQVRGFPDVNTVMGRLVFSTGTTKSQTYKPFSRDSQRELQELFILFESAPDDDSMASPSRWRMWNTVAHRLCDVAEVKWSGLSDHEVESLTRFVPWPEPLEGCLLHALTQQSQKPGKCVIEIGSYRGRSISMIALALSQMNDDTLIFSIDPHAEQPHNFRHVQLALSQIGELTRLVQVPRPSDTACHFLRPECASLVFVDGLHTYGQVVRDFENYKPLLAPGGYMVFHDYGYGNHNGRPEADPDVRKAVDEHVFTDADFSPLLLAHTQMAFRKKLSSRFDG